jgi:cytochrome c-type biogenesis protein CcmH
LGPGFRRDDDHSEFRRQNLLGTLLLPLLLFLLITPVLAVQPDEMLKDPALEARARAISEGLRCLVCQNQSIDDSDASLAHDLRVLLRERLVAGDSDAQARDFIVARYGDYVLLKPRLTPETALLWFTPFAIVLIAALAFFLRRRKPQSGLESPLSEDERAKLADITKSPQV